jgi:hypothetical protein
MQGSLEHADIALEQADRHIADCKRRIEAQRNRLLEVERLGDDATQSANLFANLIHFLAIAEMRRERLLRFHFWAF